MEAINICIYFKGDGIISAVSELKKTKKLSYICSQAILSWKKENMTVSEINAELKKQSKLKKQIQKEEKSLIEKKKKLEKDGQMKQMSEKKKTNLLKNVEFETGVKGELLEKLQKFKRPDLTTARNMMKNTGIVASKIWKAWDMLHGVQRPKKKEKLVQVAA